MLVSLLDPCLEPASQQSHVVMIAIAMPEFRFFFVRFAHGLLWVIFLVACAQTKRM